MDKKILSLILVCFLGSLSATDMDHKAKTIRTVQTQWAGIAEVTCNNPGDWSFDVTASVDDGRDVVTVKITSSSEALPPSFGVFYRVPGAGVQNVWVSDCERDACHLLPQLWWGWTAKYSSQLAKETPIAVGFNSSEKSPVALACSEAFNAIDFGLYADDRTCEIVGRCEFFARPTTPIKEYSVSVMLDRRNRDFAATVRDCSQWVSRQNGFESASIPESAFDPLYSTWYAYLQDVHADELEEEARQAAALGMKTMILDDGWQKVDSATFYSATGDWLPVSSRFLDMKKHVKAVHDAGLKYMLWLSVPYVGDETMAWDRFKDKLLITKGDKSPGRIGVLDPRFPEVREYLISTYERVVGTWGFDGVKLDFIDQFAVAGTDPAVKENYAGRDYRSVPEAVDRLMKDVLVRLKKINPEVLVEFRQHYMGPAILQYGNMMRCLDCPADPCANRRRVCDLRLTSDTLAVHSDMLVWSKDETPEGAALPILNVLFSTIQYSMILNKIEPAHREVICSWLKFSQDHRDALLKGGFKPHHAENGYTWAESWDDKERIVVTYAGNQVLPVGADGRVTYAVNATHESSLVLDLDFTPTRAEAFDTLGRSVGIRKLTQGLNRVDVPPCGYLKVSPCVVWPARILSDVPRSFSAEEYQTNGVDVVFLEGLPYHGKPTKVFCYYGIPEHKPGEKVPGMVLVHGGGGSAFYRWVRFWNAKGYAAISIDTCGCVSGNTLGSEQRKHFRHHDGGPAGWGGFSQLDEKIEDQWLYHAVADVAIANSFLRSLDGVDPDRIGLTGVSWGGVISSIASSVDGRFKFVAPVYGCGAFLENSPMWEEHVARMGHEKVAEWRALWDPINYLASAKMPIHWLAGTNDRAFSLPALRDSYAVVPSKKSLAVKVRLSHTHGKPSEEARELVAWADYHLKGIPLPRPVRAELNFTRDRDSSWTNRKWETVGAELADGGPVVQVPASASAYYLNTFAEDGFVESTPLVEIR